MQRNTVENEGNPYIYETDFETQEHPAESTVREGLIRWVKVRAEEVKQQRRIDDLRESRGEVPSASTRHSSTTFKPAPKIIKCKEVIRENKGQTQTRTKIGKRVVVINERMGAISKRIAQREKRGDG